MQKKYFTFLVVSLCYFIGFSQNNEIKIDAQLFLENRTIVINQQITYYNHSNSALSEIYLHNWANAYKDRSTTLSKRLIENYDKSLYFAKIKKRGFSKIDTLTSLQQSIKYKSPKDSLDIVKINLSKPLAVGDSITLNANYSVKVPLDIFTRYGYSHDNYDLRYWYLVPAVYQDKWVVNSNLDMDDLYVQPTNYNIEFKVPLGYTLNSDLQSKPSIQENFVLYKLTGNNRTDIELNIQLQRNYATYDSENTKVVTNLKGKNLTENIKTDVLSRQLKFIEGFLGAYPHDKILVSDITYLKNPVYGLNQLPKRFTPFSDVFEWDIKIFKALTKKYIENTVLVNKRDDYWIADGIQIFLMMKYVDQYYPEIKAIGGISKIWGIKRYNIAKLDFNGKYPFVYQFAARKNLDQSLITRADSLSNFNRKIVNAYKAGLGLQYLDEYIQDSVLQKSLQEFYQENVLQLTNSKHFNDIIIDKSPKNLDWFFEEYLQTKKKLDYTIAKIQTDNDSIKVKIENKSNFSAPITLYGVHKKDIISKQWIEPIDSIKTITVSKKGIDRLSLNYEYLYPELNLRNNWKKVGKKLLNRPLKFTFFKDIEDPYYNQIFFNAYFAYNYYDGIILGPSLYNQAMFKKKWLFHVVPTYGFKSNSLTGSFSVAYQHLPENGPVYRYNIGFAGGQSHYDQGLLFTKYTPFITIDFNRNSLRDVGGKSLIARVVSVDKEYPENIQNTEAYNYNIFNLRYGYTKPEIIKDLRYFADFQYAGDFSKISLDFRYRKLTDNNRQYDFRLFLGTFLHNNTESDFFSFALDRPSDYMFDYNYFGRSEDDGFLSQEIIISEGGFKSMFDNQFANQWMLTTNASVGIWRWVEAYADAGFYKSKHESAQFKYDTGIRLNFIHNFLELYFPLQSSLGFEPAQPNYASKIRFVITLSPTRIYNFIKRGFY